VFVKILKFLSLRLLSSYNKTLADGVSNEIFLMQLARMVRTYHYVTTTCLQCAAVASISRTSLLGVERKTNDDKEKTGCILTAARLVLRLQRQDDNSLG